MADPLKTPVRYPALADPQQRPRQFGIATFFRTPSTQDLAEADIGIFGVPFDGGVTCRAGTRHGPRAVREQSALMRKVNTATGSAPFDGLRVRDLDDCWIEEAYDLRRAHAEIAAFATKVSAAGVTPLAVGGDHSVSLPLLRGVAAAHGPLGLVHVDAHNDTGDDYMGSDIHHGTPFRRAVEEGLIDPTRVIQVGIRGHAYTSGGLWGFSQDSGMRVLGMDEFQDRGWRWAVEEALRVAGDGPTYLTFDIDSLDPVWAPGTGTPEAGGLQMTEALRFLRGLENVDFVGADLVEVSPPFDVGTTTSFSAASILFELLCLLADARKRRRRRSLADFFDEIEHIP
jgi:guanidinopropionase